MCTNKYHLINRYMKPYKNQFLVDCGKCPACQQARANKRCARIKLHSRNNDIFALFVTLTYDNSHIPYIDVDDLPFFLDSDEPFSVNVYRNCMSRYNSNTGVLNHKQGKHIIGKVIIDSQQTYFTEDNVKHHVYNRNFDIKGCIRPTKFPSNSIAICYNKDFTSFIKRLKINLSRLFLNYDKNKYILHSFYKVSEYGPSTLRPHFHALLFFEKRFYQQFDLLRRAIIKAWPFCDSNILYSEIEVARNPASYVSSYVNRGSSFPDFLKVRSVSPSSSHSRFFAVCDEYFSPSQILKKIDNGNFEYTDNIIGKDGIPVQCSFPIPEYVCNFYFPKIKGFNELSLSKIYSILVRTPVYQDIGYLMNYTYDEYLSFVSAIKRCRTRLNLDIFQYAFYYCQYLKIKQRTIFKYQYNDTPIYERYYNLSDAITRNFFYADNIESYKNSTDYKKFSSILIKDKELETRYFQNIKQRKLNEYTRSLNIKYYE